MDKEDNQFFTLAQHLKGVGGNNKQLYYNGTIISISPLVVDIGGLQLDREDIQINADLLKGSKRKAKITATNVTGNLETEHGGTLNSFNMSNGETENLENVFKIGDKVILITNDSQMFVLLCIVR